MNEYETRYLNVQLMLFIYEKSFSTESNALLHQIKSKMYKIWLKTLLSEMVTHTHGKYISMLLTDIYSLNNWS